MVRPSGDSIQGIHRKWGDVELTFVCTGKQSISVEPTKYFLNVSFVFLNVVRIDENVVQIYDDNDIDHIREDVIH